MPVNTTPIDERFAVFSYSAFRYYWLSRFLGSFAFQIMSTAIAWQVYDLTRNPFDLGLIGLIQFLPSLLLLLLTGTAADRYGRKNIMIICLFGSSIAGGFLFYITYSGLTSPNPIFICLFFIGVLRAFFAPAAQSLAANIVPAKILPNAIAWNSMSWQSATIAGPAVGGLLYGVSDIAPYLVGSLFLIFAAVALTIGPKITAPKRLETIDVSMFLAGFKYIWKEKIVLGAISLDMFAILLGGTIALLPIYARDILDLGSFGLGMLRAAPGLGALAIAILLAAKPLQKNVGKTMLITVAIFGLATTVFGLSTITWLSISALVIMGGADMISVFIRQNLIQLWTPDALRGRVSAVNMVFIGTSNELGEFRAGGMAGLAGAVPAVVIGGIGAMGVAGLWAYLFPELRKVKRLQKD